MTRRQLFSIVLGTSLCLALAGAAVAQTTAPFKGEPKFPAAPVKPVPGLKLTATHLWLTNTSTNSVVQEATSGVLTTVNIAQRTSYKLRIQLKNNNQAGTTAQTITVHIIGGVYDGSKNSYPLDKKTPVSVQAIGPYATIYREITFTALFAGWHQFAVVP